MPKRRPAPAPSRQSKRPLAPSADDLAAQQLLARYYVRNGVLRQPDPARRAADPLEYKKGYEIRLVAFDARELATIRRALRAAGFKIGRAFEKVNRRVQPIYGKAQVERFVELVQTSGVATD